MLFNLRDFIAREQVASLQYIARHFNIQEGALLPMLDVWLKAGQITQIQSHSSCQSTCQGCVPSALTYYQYVIKKL